MYALIHGKRIAQISATTFPVAPPLHWVDAPEGVTTRHTYVGSEFVAPEGPTLDEARTAAIERVEAGYRQALRSFEYAGTTWDASDDSATVLRDLLNRLANNRGLPRGKSVVTLRDTTGATHDMDAAAIIDLGAAGSDHRDECLEIRLSLIDQVRSPDTVAEAEAIDWPT